MANVVTCSNINSPRYPIPDVPVLYLVEPTAANIQLITSDLSRGLYSPAYINFLSAVPRPLLEDFAAQIASTGTSENIAQVFDQYLNFIVAEPDLFSLSMGKDTYCKINSATTKDDELDAVIDRIVSGLFSVSVTMGMSNPQCFSTGLTSSRSNTCPSMPKRRCCRVHSHQTRPQTPRPHTQFEGQPLLWWNLTSIHSHRRRLISPCLDYCRQKCGPHTYAVSFLDLPIPRQ
jgi:hypothetical protein